MDKHYCPKCGNELKAGAKFCPKCGAQLTATPAANNGDTVAATKAFSSNYFNWFLDTIKFASKGNEDTNKFFGLVSFVISAILSAVTILLAIKPFEVIMAHLMLANPEAFNMSEDDLSAYSFNDIVAHIDQYMHAEMHSVLVKLSIIAVIMIVCFVVVAFLAKKCASLGTGEKTNMFSFMNKLASYTNLSVLILIVNVLATLLLGASAFKVMIVLFFAAVVNALVGFTYAIVDGKSSGKIDKSYIAMIALFVLLILLAVVFKVIG